MDVKIERRVVVVDEGDRSRVISDGPSPSVITDPARPGFRSALLWVTDRTPVRLKDLRESLSAGSPLIRPPPGGSLCRVVTFPPDATFVGRIGWEDVSSFYRSVGAPHVSTSSPGSPHPYMQKTGTLDFCLVVEGRITLVLDTDEVDLTEGDIVVQRGTNHAWSNRSDKPCKIVFSEHDAFE